MEKKGQELSIGTLVLIVLGVIVLVLLVLGFSMGWDNLFSKIGIYSGSDISSMVAACKVAVSTQSKGSYCEFKNVKVEGGKEFVNCEDSRIILDDKLSGCPTSENKCYELLRNKKSVEDKYNGQTCKDTLVISKVSDCASIKIKETPAVEPIGSPPACAQGQIDVGYLISKDKKCCWTPPTI